MMRGSNYQSILYLSKTEIDQGGQPINQLILEFTYLTIIFFERKVNYHLKIL